MAKNTSDAAVAEKELPAVKSSTAIAEVPEIDFFADSGMGMENVDAQSVAIPFLTVLQGLSPQIETVDGAKPGLIINTVTNELKNEIEVIPCGFQRKFLRWTPRTQGGGFKGEMSVVEYERAKAEGKIQVVDKGEKGTVEVLEGDEIRDTRVHFVMVLSNGMISPAVISLSSTQIKVSKRFIALIGGVQMKAPNGKIFNPPSFANSYKASTEKVSNEKGTWYTFKFEKSTQVTDAKIYNACKKFNGQISEGKAVAVHNEATEMSSVQGEAEDNEF
jgi:hypothetical protein